MITFTVPTPPSVNNLFVNVPGKGRVRSQRYQAWAHAAGWAMRIAGWNPPLTLGFRGPVSVTILNGNARQDIDNCAKGILDLLTEMQVIEDDKQVVGLHITRGGKPKEAIVTVREI